MTDFEKGIADYREEKRKRADWRCYQNERIGEHIYTRYRIFCNIHYGGKEKQNAIMFAHWLKREGIELNFWQRKHLAETYFGWRYNYNYEKEDWEIKKV